MPRLIDADALLEDGIRVSYAYNNDGIILIPMGEVRRSIKNATTIDAVEVVRCKDCEHYGWEQEPCHGKTQHFCKLHKGLVVVDRDTFCSYGERRCDNE